MISSNRNWKIPYDKPVGYMVSSIQAKDEEGDSLLFGLEPIDFGLRRGQEPGWLPFVIDNTTGEVYLNESLKDKVKITLFSSSGMSRLGEIGSGRSCNYISRCEYGNDVSDLWSFPGNAAKIVVIITKIPNERRSKISRLP